MIILILYERHEENRRKIEMEDSSMNARKCVHAQRTYTCQAFAHESSKVGGRETGKTEADGKKGSPTKQNTSEELKQGLPRHRSD